MDVVTDLHLHSKYSRAVSKDMNLYNMALWGDKKGLDIVSTGDWTHPLWLREIKQQLSEDSEGVFRLKEKDFKTRFILSVEISSIYSQNGKVRRIHNLLFSPGIETSEKIVKELLRLGCNLSSDGRPIIGLSSVQLADLAFSIDERVMLIPCHIWTPWFSMFGSNSGFDSLSECFGEYSDRIYGIETGLSSDPYMNWQIKDIENLSILSFSDAHSLPKMGREATVFVTKEGVESTKINYEDLRAVIKQDKTSRLRTGYTVEFYPEEGKYHYSGHRNCNFVQSPGQTKENGEICPVCHKRMTIGVMHRVEELSGEEFPEEVVRFNANGIKWNVDPNRKHPPFVRLVPLNEIIAESISSTVSSLKVQNLYNQLCELFGSELNVLLKVKKEDIEKEAGARIAEGVDKVRRGDIVILPGFDGQYGIVKIWDDKKVSEKYKDSADQLGIDF